MAALARTSRRERRRRASNVAVWLAASILGAMAIASAAGIIHEGSQRRAAAKLFVGAVADQVGAVARERLELLALEKLAPASESAARPRSVLTALVAREREARRCACRDSVAASEFLHWSRSSDSVDVAVVESTSGVTRTAPALLAAVARADAARSASAGPSIHLTAEKSLGDRAVVTVARYDTSGHAGDVYGFVVEARALAAMLLDQSRDSIGRGIRLDSASLVMETRDSVTLYGRAGMRDAAAAAGRAVGPLDGVRIILAVDSWQLPRAFLGPARQQLWHLGALILGTAIALGLAAGWSQREVMLARARSDFIAGVSHDLRMPLAQILLASETLTADRARDERERLGLASSILREARRLIGMVENILLFSQSGAVEDEARLDPVAIDELFEDVVESVHLAVADAGQRIEVTPAPGLGVLGSRRALRQALVNLVDNAIKYGKPGQRILLGAARRDDRTVWLTVDDQGPGIPGAERRRLFDAYERLARDQSSERTGTGLGLAVVRRIVAQCQGRAWLDAAQGGGTRAVIELRESAIAVPAASPRQPEPV